MGIIGATDRSARPRFRLRQGEISWRHEPDGFVLYDRRTDSLYEGNSPGGQILQCLDQGASIDALQTAISARYGISPDQADDDVADFLQFLVHEDLVTPW